MSEVIIVAGMEYPKYTAIPHNAGAWALHRLAAGPWRDVALLWTARELRTPDTAVTLFDMARGTIERHEKGRRTPAIVGRRPTPIAGDWRVHGEADHENPPLRVPTPVLRARRHPILAYAQGTTALPDPVTKNAWRGRYLGVPALGMQDVYDHICDIGRRRPATLRGLHIFSHAYGGGPILCNSWGFPPVPTVRDRYDTDGRMDVDFRHAAVTDNLPPIDKVPAADLINGTVARTWEWFDAAWSEEALAVVWGCDKDPLAARLIRGVVDAVGTAPTGNPVIPYRFDGSRSWGLDLGQWQKLFTLTPKDTEARVRLTFVRDRIAAICEETYAFALRRALTPEKHPHTVVCTAPPGTATTIDDPRTAGPATAMSVAGDRDLLSFYRNVMRFPFAVELGGRLPFGRGYVAFEHSLAGGS